jgi:hypothetical protein
LHTSHHTPPPPRGGSPPAPREKLVEGKAKGVSC